MCVCLLEVIEEKGRERGRKESDQTQTRVCVCVCVISTCRGVGMFLCSGGVV